MQTTTCPPSEQLKAYLAGKLDQDTSESLSQHLEGCHECGQTATQLEQEPDTLVELLQAALPPVDKSWEIVGQEPTSLSGEIFPKVLGQYELQARLGSGGMGAVYLARHTSLDKRVAIKLLPTLPAQKAEFVSRFQREMRAAGKLEHPAIVRTTDAGERQGIHFLVMEAIDGLNLSRIACSEGKLPIADACEMVRQAALGLSHAHDKGIVHRDIKPSNLMLDAAGQVRILDFGLAQIGFWESGSAEITTVGQMMGTLDYMAPEQAEHSGAVDYRADLYSLGATLFRLLTGRAPLAAAPNLTPIEKLRLLATHWPPKLRSLRADAPEDLGQIVDAMLAREPASRPASAIHVAELIAPFCVGADLADLLRRARSRPNIQEPEFEINPLLQRDVMELREDCQSPRADMPDCQSLVEHSGMNGQNPTVARSTTVGSGRMSGRWLTGLALSGFAGLLCSGLWLVLETNKGQLVIDSQANVQVKILRVNDGDRKNVEELQIQPGTQTTRLRSGQYEIILDAASDSLSVTNESFTIRNGQTVVARIMPQRSPEPTVTVHESRDTHSADATADSNRLDELVYDGQNLSTWLQRLQFERNPREVSQALKAIAALADTSLREVLEPSLVEYIVSMDPLENSVVAPSYALAQCCREDYFNTVARILPRMKDDHQRIQLLSKSKWSLATNPVRTEQDLWLLLRETSRLLASESPEIVRDTAAILRYIADGVTGQPAAVKVQQEILQQLVDAPSVTNENFWLASPQAYELESIALQSIQIKAVTLRTCKTLSDEVLRRGLAILADIRSSSQAVTQAAIVMRTFADSGMKFAESRQSNVVDGLKHHLQAAIESPKMAVMDVGIPKSLRFHVAPTLSHGEFERDSNFFIPKGNKLISILNLIQASDLQKPLKLELEKLHSKFHELPLYKNRFVDALRTPGGERWMFHYSQNDPIVLGQDLISASIYLQTGFLLDLDAQKLFLRFKQQLPTDELP